jgi:hypothetical protein
MARAFSRHDKTETKMAHRKVYATDHPDVFEVISSNGRDRYRIVLLWIGEVFWKALCSCHAGRHEQDCWHARLVILRRVHGRESRRKAA